MTRCNIGIFSLNESVNEMKSRAQTYNHTKMKKYFAVYLKNLSVCVLFFWREVAVARVMLIFN